MAGGKCSTVVGGNYSTVTNNYFSDQSPFPLQGELV